MITKKRQRSPKTALKQRINWWGKSDKPRALRPIVARMQELYNKIKPLQMKRLRGQLTMEEKKKLAGLEERATILLEAFEQQKTRSG